MSYRRWHFDIDDYLNYVVPPAPWPRLPYPLARFFGYRREKPAPTGNLMPIFWAFVGIWCSITIIEQVNLNVPSFAHRHSPIIVGSFGAAAVLEFLAIDSPLAQPRNAIVGQVLSSVVGVAVAKLFLLSGDRFESIKWAGGAVACASATAIMALTKTVHPPAGATALLAVTDPEIVHLSWFLIPVVLLGAVLMQAVALVINNIERRFPVYFWTPEDLTGKSIFARGRGIPEDEEATGQTGPARKPGQSEEGEEDEGSSEEEPAHGGGEDGEDTLVVRGSGLVVPAHLELSKAERQVLEEIQARLKKS